MYISVPPVFFFVFIILSVPKSKLSRIFIHEGFKVSENEALNEALSAKEVLLIELIKNNPFINQKEIIEISGISRTHVQRIMKLLQEKGLLCREGGKKYGKW